MAKYHFDGHFTFNGSFDVEANSREDARAKILDSIWGKLSIMGETENEEIEYDFDLEAEFGEDE